MRIMSVDLGDARTGIAICDQMELLASPVEVIAEKDRDVLLEKVKAHAVNNRAELIVVGYPKNMDGSIGERATKSSEFADRLTELTNLPVKLWDERQTTITATNYLNITNTRGKKRKSIIDAVAACVILESYLNYRKMNKNKQI